MGVGGRRGLALQDEAHPGIEGGQQLQGLAGEDDKGDNQKKHVVIGFTQAAQHKAEHDGNGEDPLDLIKRVKDQSANSQTYGQGNAGGLKLQPGLHKGDGANKTQP